MKLKQIQSKLQEAIPQPTNPQVKKPVGPSQSQQNAVHLQRMNALVRAGALKQNELPMLKLAIRRLSTVPNNDVARLPRNQREIYGRYMSNVTNAAMGSQSSFNATKRNIAEVRLEKDGAELVLEVRYVPNLYQNPPMLLILKRTGMRLFPDGHRVAIYKNDKTGFVFTIPFDQAFNTNVAPPPGGVSLTGMQEELIVEDDVLEEIIDAIEYANELEQLDEVQNVQKMGRIKLIRARVRAGKVQRRKKFSAVKGYTLRGGRLKRMTQMERMHRRRAQRRAKVKRRAKMARALIKRKRSLRKRKALGLK